MADTDRLVDGYARAIFAVAEAEGTLEQVEDELYRFGKMLERETRLREALTDPQLPAENKDGIIEELVGSRATRHTVGLLRFIVEQGRAKDLPKIVDALARYAAERQRRAVAEVRSAIPLDAEQRLRLAQALSRATGKDVELKVLVDESLIGGVEARVGDQVFDGSIRRRLELAREQLSRARQ